MTSWPCDELTGTLTGDVSQRSAAKRLKYGRIFIASLLLCVRVGARILEKYWSTQIQQQYNVCSRYGHGNAYFIYIRQVSLPVDFGILLLTGSLGLTCNWKIRQGTKITCNTVGGPWWVCSLFRSVAGQLFLQYFDAVGWVF